VSAIPHAASVLLARAPGSAEILLVRRADALRFFGGFFAFPGGKVAPADASVASRPAERGPVQQPALRACRIGAIRELFEETGVLLARRPDGSFPASGSDLDHLRREVVAERTTFAEALAQLDATPWDADLALVGELITPAFSSLRFATTFFGAHLPPNQTAEVWPGELEEGQWVDAAVLVERWTRGECLVTPPTIGMLQLLAGQPVDQAAALLGPLLRSLAAGATHPIHFAPGVQLLPLRTDVLPPSTHTNAYLIGQGSMYLLDPGTTIPEEEARLFAVLDGHQASGRRLTAVVLSHHHPDHTGAAAACADRYAVPVWAHPLTARALEGKVRITRTIQDAESLPLGTAPDGSPDWHLRALHTPGHAPGHLAFYEPHYRLLFAGDMVSTMTSVVIAPPDGDLAVYLDSLRHLREYPCRLLLPSHGNGSASPRRTIDECIDHRLKREAQLLELLHTGPWRIVDLALEMYRGLPPALMRFAELQILAGLRKLQHEGRAEPNGTGEAERWRLRPTTHPHLSHPPELP
jgi:glyoxylase-like metal-dependent hydrolase (beta-lactamase superfamily II)/8-oxo-dGTP pyrophosphatase MutT (NUDIX family)